MSSHRWICALALRALAACAALPLAACGQGEARGFALPPGDADAGQELFLSLACNDCHSVVGRAELREGVSPFMTVPLGGPTARVRTYGELVTSIINPSHRISERYRPDPDVSGDGSPMANYNDIVTVTELVDLMAFLQGEYTALDVPPAGFAPYSYPDEAP